MSAYKRKQNVVFYYWSPTPLVGAMDLVKLEMPPYDAEKHKCLTSPKCAKPEPSAYPDNPVCTAVNTKFSQEAPVLTEFLSKVSVPLPVMNETPVSYTHLDVYKRQIRTCSSSAMASSARCDAARRQGRSSRRSRDSRAVCTFSSTVIERKVAAVWKVRPTPRRQILPAGRPTSSRPSRPVSYTHLDVYKRQGPGGSFLPRGRIAGPGRTAP